jgi:hypothetical protein
MFVATYILMHVGNVLVTPLWLSLVSCLGRALLHFNGVTMKQRVELCFDEICIHTCVDLWVSQ